MTVASGRFLVLARRAYTEALVYQGALDSGADEELSAAATSRFGTDWLELVLAPATAVHWVIEPEILEPTA